MAAHNTYRSISYQLTVKEDAFVVRCVMLLFRARLLTGQSGFLIDPIVRCVQKRRPVLPRFIKAARLALREHHTVDIAMLINREEQT